MTEMRDCLVEDGRIFAENNGKRVTLAGKDAILLHNSWIGVTTGEHHQVGLDFRSDPASAIGEASTDCQRLVKGYFTDIIDEILKSENWEVTEEYLGSLPEIYRDILRSYPEVEPGRSAGDCLAFQTLYLALKGKYEMGEIRTACDQMAMGNAMVIRNRTFACPTRLGEEIITKLTGHQASKRAAVPAFSPPRTH